MKYVNIISVIIIIHVTVYCYGEYNEDNDDESEADEHAYKWNNIDVDDLSNEVKRTKRSRRYSISRGRGSIRSDGSLRSGRRFRLRSRYRRPFATYSEHPAPSVRKPASSPSVRKPASAKPAVASPAVHHPQDVNKPAAVSPVFNGGNEMVQRPNPILTNNNPGTYQGVYNPNAYRPPPYNPNVNRPPASTGANGMGQQQQQPNQVNNNRPGGMPMPIPIPFPIGNPFGGHNRGAHNQNPHNQSAQNRSSHNGGNSCIRYQCGEYTKRFLFAIICVSVAIVYYLQ